MRSVRGEKRQEGDYCVKNDKTELFERLPIPKAVAQLAIPTILSSLVMVIYNMADTYFVGMLNDPVQNAAVTLASPVLLAFNAVNNLFGVGGSSMMSRALGSRDYDTVRGSAAFSFYCAFGASLLISLFYTVFHAPMLHVLGADATTTAATSSYLFWTVTCGACPAILNVVLSNMIRSEGYSMHASIGVMSGCLLNILLDPFFILPGFIGLGAAGAGLATFISNCVACIYFFVLLFVRRRSTCVCLNPAFFRVKREAMISIFVVGIPAAVQNLLNVTSMTLLNNFTSSYGADAVAAMGIAYKINLVPMYICTGLTQGIMPLVSYNYTGGDHRRMKDGIFFVLKISLVISVGMMAVLYLSAGNMIGLFMENEGIIAYGILFLRGFCIGIPFMAVDFLAVGVFQAVGKGGYSLLFAILRKVVLEIPALFILNYLFTFHGLPYAHSITEMGLALAAVIVWRHLSGQMDRTPLQE